MTHCTFFDPATGVISHTATLSEETLEYYVDNGAHAILDILGDPKTHYVANNELVAYSEAELSAKDNLPAGWIWQMPERVAVDTRDLQSAKDRTWERIKAARAAAELADFTHNGNTYQADRERITGAVTAAILAQLAGAPYSIVWTLSDNSTVTLDGVQMMGVGAALAQRVKEVFSRGVELRAAIASATTNAQLDALAW